MTSEGYTPHTPLEPYPIPTHQASSTSQGMNLVDSRVFGPWETQYGENAGLLVQEDGSLLTQIEPLDLTLSLPTCHGIHPVFPRKLAFHTYSSLPLDLRVSSRMTTGITTPSNNPITNELDSQFPSPVTQRFFQRLALVEDTFQGQVASAEFPDDEDELFMDIVTLENMTSSAVEDDNKSDAETKLSELCSPTKKARMLQHYHTDVQLMPVTIPLPTRPPPPTEPNEGVDQELLQCQEDLIASSWATQDKLLETIFPVRKLVFCTTRQSPEQRRKLESLCIQFGGEIRKELTNEVTHLLVQIQNNRTPFTFKYLMAIALKKWILTFDWVEECLRTGRIVPEEKYETSNFCEYEPGVRISRLTSSLLFHDFNFHVPRDLTTSSISAAACEQLLRALGATVLEYLPLFNKRLLIIGDYTGSTASYKKWFDTRRWLTVSWDWVLDCLLSYKLIPLSSEHTLTPGAYPFVLSQVLVPRPMLTI